MKLRPHHVLDIITSYGKGEEFTPHHYGHALHTVALSIISDIDQKVEFVIGADEICVPCMHLGPDGKCRDMLSKHVPPELKQDYNDRLDERLVKYLELPLGILMSMREYLELVNGEVPGIEQFCTHPGEDMGARLDGLTQGLSKIGIRKSEIGNNE